MNPLLLDSIEQVENKYGSVASPYADLTNIHHIVKSLGLFGNETKKHKNRLLEYNNIVLTINPKIMKIYYYLLNGRSHDFIRKRVHVDGGVVRKVGTVIHLHKKLKLINECLIKSIEGQNSNMVKFL